VGILAMQINSKKQKKYKKKPTIPLPQPWWIKLRGSKKVFWDYTNLIG
jgi:hypothetical protein